MLFEQNNEKVSRASIRSTVVGNAKVMSYDDIVEAQRRREVKGIASKTLPKGGCNRDPSADSHARTDPVVMEMDKGQREINALGLKDFCSILHFT